MVLQTTDVVNVFQYGNKGVITLSQNRESDPDDLVVA